MKWLIMLVLVACNAVYLGILTVLFKVSYAHFLNSKVSIILLWIIGMILLVAVEYFIVKNIKLKKKNA